MTDGEWESLCDGCAKCCLLKLEDTDDDDIVYFTDVACRLLALGSCRCQDYDNRLRRVASCIKLAPERADLLANMPPSCAYRRIAEGRGLPDWHHLISGDPDQIHRQGHSIRSRVVPECDVDEADLEDHIVEWPLDE